MGFWGTISDVRWQKFSREPQMYKHFEPNEHDA